jgi:hypothetical protein
MMTAVRSTSRSVDGLFGEYIGQGREGDQRNESYQIASVR